LEVRIKEQIKNAYLLAKFLEGHPKIEKVLYPGLESHP
jgi:cystathionine beta-lyase/cystathionine gamma-synthase